MTDLQAVSDYYRRKDKNPITMGQMFRDTLATNGQKHIAAALNISPGTVSHYTRLLLLPPDLQRAVAERRLQFKVARLFAAKDFTTEDAHRLITPFMDGTLSSTYAERYAILAKKHPRMNVSDLTQTVLGLMQPVKPVKAPEPPVIKQRERVRPLDVSRLATELAGTLMACEWDSTVDALLARSMLKRLLPLIDEAIKEKSYDYSTA